jgi:hypothetical protein
VSPGPALGELPVDHAREQVQPRAQPEDAPFPAGLLVSGPEGAPEAEVAPEAEAPAETPDADGAVGEKE